jgi:hypothetical protein
MISLTAGGMHSCIFVAAGSRLACSNQRKLQACTSCDCGAACPALHVTPPEVERGHLHRLLAGRSAHGHVHADHIVCSGCSGAVHCTLALAAVRALSNITLMRERVYQNCFSRCPSRRSLRELGPKLLIVACAVLFWGISTAALAFVQLPRERMLPLRHALEHAAAFEQVNLGPPHHKEPCRSIAWSAGKVDVTADLRVRRCYRSEAVLWPHSLVGDEHSKLAAFVTDFQSVSFRLITPSTVASGTGQAVLFSTIIFGSSISEAFMEPAFDMRTLQPLLARTLKNTTCPLLPAPPLPVNALHWQLACSQTDAGADPEVTAAVIDVLHGSVDLQVAAKQTRAGFGRSLVTEADEAVPRVPAPKYVRVGVISVPRMNLLGAMIAAFFSVLVYEAASRKLIVGADATERQREEQSHLLVSSNTPVASSSAAPDPIPGPNLEQASTSRPLGAITEAEERPSRQRAPEQQAASVRLQRQDSPRLGRSFSTAVSEFVTDPVQRSAAAKPQPPIPGELALGLPNENVLDSLREEIRRNSGTRAGRSAFSTGGASVVGSGGLQAKSGLHRRSGMVVLPEVNEVTQPPAAATEIATPATSKLAEPSVHVQLGPSPHGGSHAAATTSSAAADVVAAR